MPQADGTVLIDTEINTDGMEAGGKEVEAASRRMADSVENIGTKAKAALNKQVDSFVKLNQEYAAQAKKVEELRQKVEAYGNQKVPTNEYQILTNQIEKLESSLDRAIEKQIRFTETGGDTGSRTFRQMEYDIEQIAQKLDEARAAREQLESSGKAFTLGTDTSAAAADMNRLAEAERRLADMNNRLGTSYSSIKGQVNDYKESVVKATSEQNKFNKSLKNTDKSAKKGNMSLGRMLGTSILFSFVFQAISAVMTGVREGFENLAQYSTSTNRSLSMLMSSLTRLKNAFATAFAPILDVVAPILSRFIDMISMAATAVGQFIAALTGKNTFVQAVAVQEDYAASLNNTANAAKKASKYLSGLDEINVYSTNDSTSGGTADGTVSPSDMFEEVQINPKILAIAEKVKSVFESILTPIKEAWNTNSVGIKIMSALEGILKNILGFVNDIVNSTISWASSLNFYPLLNAIKNLFEQISPLVSTIGQFLSTIYTTIILPVGTFLIETLIPGILNAISGLLKFLNENSWIIELIGSLLIGAFAASKIVPLITTIIGAVKGIIAALGASGLGGAISSVVSALGGPLTIAITAVIAILVLLVTHWDEVKAAMQKFDQWLQGVFSTDWTEAFGMFGGVITAFFKLVEDIWNSIKRLFNGIITFVSGVFLGDWEKAWEGIKEIFASVWDAFVGLVKSPINLIIGIINGLLYAVQKMQNGIADALNKLHIDIPGWLQKLTGMESFGFNIGKWTAPQIPYLASGAVIPPNSPFLAVLGDQKNGNNLEVPESLLRKLLREELNGNNQQGAASYTFVGQINRRVLFEEFMDEAKVRQMRTGKNPFELA